MKKKIKALKYMLSLFKLRWLSQIPVLKRRITRINKVYKPDGHKMSAYILKPVKALLLGAVFCFLGVISSTIAEDLPHSKGPFFYRADKDGKSLYLLGTIHFENLYQLQCHSPIMSFLESSNLLWTETSEETVLQIGDEFLEDVSKSNGQEFNSLNESNKRFLVDILKSATQKSYSDEYYIEKLQQLNFWYIANFILNSCISLEQLTIAGVAMDFKIQEFADRMIIPQDFLDDIKILKEFAILTFPFQDYIPTAKDINLMIDNYDHLCKSARDNILVYYQSFPMFQNLYQTSEMNGSDIEDWTKLEYQKGSFYYSFFDKPIPEDKSFEAFKDTALKKRNQKWMEKIRQSHEDNDSVFIAVGLGHLIGSDNILDMLREDDFFIQRMNANCSFNSAL